MNGEAPLAHEEAVGLLDALRDGELDATEAARVEAHLETCDRCRAVESALGGGLRKAVTSGLAADEPNLLPGVQKRLRLRSRGRFYGREEPTRKIGISPWPLLVASVAILIALAVGYVTLGQVGNATSAPGPAPSNSKP
jgi:anti-sigma factor RsiW